MSTMKIYYGQVKPLTAVGANQVRLLQFLERFPGDHTMAQDRATLRAVRGLVKRGSIFYSPDTQQARIVYAKGAA